MNAYHVCGIAFAVWAVLVSFVGITREEFPATPAAQRTVGAISILLAVATIGSAIYIGVTEGSGHSGGSGHALVPPL